MENEEVFEDLADIEVTDPPADWVPVESEEEIAIDAEFDEDG